MPATIAAAGPGQAHQAEQPRRLLVGRRRPGRGLGLRRGRRGRWRRRRLGGRPQPSRVDQDGAPLGIDDPDPVARVRVDRRLGPTVHPDLELDGGAHLREARGLDHRLGQRPAPEHRSLGEHLLAAVAFHLDPTTHREAEPTGVGLALPGHLDDRGPLRRKVAVIGERKRQVLGADPVGVALPLHQHVPARRGLNDAGPPDRASIASEHRRPLRPALAPERRALVMLGHRRWGGLEHHDARGRLPLTRSIVVVDLGLGAAVLLPDLGDAAFVEDPVRPAGPNAGTGDQGPLRGPEVLARRLQLAAQAQVGRPSPAAVGGAAEADVDRPRADLGDPGRVPAITGAALEDRGPDPKTLGLQLGHRGGVRASPGEHPLGPEELVVALVEEHPTELTFDRDELTALEAPAAVADHHRPRRRQLRGGLVGERCDALGRERAVVAFGEPDEPREPMVHLRAAVLHLEGRPAPGLPHPGAQPEAEHGLRQHPVALCEAAQPMVPFGHGARIREPPPSSFDGDASSVRRRRLASRRPRAARPPAPHRRGWLRPRRARLPCR